MRLSRRILPASPPAFDPARYAGLDLLTSAVIILDAEGRMVFANTAAETMLDFSLRTMRGQRLSSMLVDGSFIDEAERQLD